MHRAVLISILCLGFAAPANAQECPATGAPSDPKVPTWEQVNGFELGSRQSTYAEVVQFMRAVDGASERVSLGVLARSFEGRDLVYAVVSEPGRTRGNGLREGAAPLRQLREGRLKLPAMLKIADESPAIAWITGGVHGNEPSATDADMRVLYELAAREDCENRRRLRELITVILPMQNPDGRENGARTNAYAFDLNRDWFARSQPETAGKLNLLHRLPPILYVDGHEQGGTAGFFPPNADPIHHEIADAPLRHINEVYSPAMRAAMDARGSDYTNYTVYDLFFMGYGDTVPATQFNAAGMTFEKGGQAPYPEKEADHFTEADTVLDVAAARKDELLADWARTWHEARAQGATSRLEPNVVVQPENQVRFPVPEQTVWAYALRADRSAADAGALVERLRSMGVEVHRLRRATRVEGFKPYGSAPITTTLPRKTWIVRLGQPHKHWVQALLGEDAYVPFPYFYDVSSWSNPLLMGLEGGILTKPIARRKLRPRRRAPLLEPVGDAALPTLKPAAAYAIDGDSAGALRLAFALLGEGVAVERVPGAGTLVVPGDTDRAELRRIAARHSAPLRALRSAPAGTVELRRPRVALLADPTLTVADVDVPGRPLGVAAALGGSTGHTKFVVERRLGEPVVQLTTAEIAQGRLSADAYSHFVVPDGLVPQGGLDPRALQQIQNFVNAGGTYLGFRGQGIEVAQGAGITSAATRSAPGDMQIPGAAFRVEVDAGSPLTWGFAALSWVFNVGDPILEPGSANGREVVRYPSGGTFFVSGYTEGADAVKGTPVATDEAFGAGRVLLLTVDPNFRAYVESTERLFANGLLYPRGADRGARRTAALKEVGPHSPARDVVVRVAGRDAAALRALAPALPGARWSASARGLTLSVRQSEPFSGHPPFWAVELLARLRERAVRPTLVIL